MPARRVTAKQAPIASHVPMWSKWGESPLLFFAALVAYWPALHGTLLWDDPQHITRPDLQSLHGLWRIWSELGATQQYYPVLHSAFWFEHRIWGDALLGYHLANVALHAAAAFLLVLILRRLAIPGALLAGAIFALHPVCVESVAWISEQKNTLSAVFYLGSALAYLGFADSLVARRRRYVLASLLFVLALLSKSVTATLPAALLVVLWWERGRLEWKRDVTPLAPWFVVAAAVGVFTAWVERDVIGAKGADFSLTLLQRCLLAGRVLWFYLAKLLWPSNLTFIYPHWTIDPSAWPPYLFPLGAMALAAVLWLLRTRSRAPLAGFLFFAGTLFPALGFVNAYPFRFSYVADHFQYLAGLGVIVPVAAGLSRAGSVLNRRAQTDPADVLNRPRYVRAVARTACIAIPLMLCVLTWRQARIYRDAETLYRDTIARNPECWMAYVNLGTEIAANPKRLEEAAAMFESALRIKPDHAQARSDLALAHIRLATSMSDDPGRLRAAIGHYEAALRVQPEDAAAQAKLGSALHLNLGTALVETPGRLSDAIAEYETALRITPDYFKAHYNLGTLLLDLPGRHADAMTHLEAAVRIQPDSPEAHLNLGIALADEPGRSADAIRQLEMALARQPDMPQAQQLLNELRGHDPVRKQGR